MLILKRKENESILISDNIRIVVVEVLDSKRVRLGIDCPKNIPVHRDEVVRAIEQAGGVVSEHCPEPTPWYENRENLLGFGRYLALSLPFSAVELQWYYENPNLFTKEFREVEEKVKALNERRSQEKT